MVKLSRWRGVPTFNTFVGDEPLNTGFKMWP